MAGKWVRHNEDSLNPGYAICEDPMVDPKTKKEWEPFDEEEFCKKCERILNDAQQ